MKLQETLTKENFFNEMMEKYPNATKEFCDWIDEYKKAVNWAALFSEDVADSTKFHDLPHAMQTGIWAAFIQEYVSRQFEQLEHPLYPFDLEEDIKQCFSELEENHNYEKN